MFRPCMCRIRGGATREYLCRVPGKKRQTPGGASPYAPACSDVGLSLYRHVVGIPCSHAVWKLDVVT